MKRKKPKLINSSKSIIVSLLKSAKAKFKIVAGSRMNNLRMKSRSKSLTLKNLTEFNLVKTNGRHRYIAVIFELGKKINLGKVAKISSSQTAHLITQIHTDAKSELPGHWLNAFTIPKSFPVILDSSLLQYSSILVGIGAEKESVAIDPFELSRIVDASVYSITDEVYE